MKTLIALAACGATLAVTWPRPDAGAVRAPLTAGDVLSVAIGVARGDHPDLDEASVRAAVAALADEYRAVAGADGSAEQRARAFAIVLFERAGFRAVESLDSADALHVDSVLARREGYCLSLSVLALAIAEAVGAPLEVVAAPNHAYVRYVDGDAHVNLELTQRGATLPDAHYERRLGGFGPGGGFYLRALSLVELHAMLLHNRGFARMERGDRDGARADLLAAIALVPTFPEAHRNLGVLAGEEQDWDTAIASLEEALRLHPGDADALFNVALCRHARGDREAALEALEMTLVLDPSRGKARALREAWCGPALEAGSRALDDPPPRLEPGLVGRYYADERFGTLVLERVDRGLDFDWGRGRPARGLPSDGSTIRWDGWLKTPRGGRCTFFLVVNDGVRIRVGGRTVVDAWRDTGYDSWTAAYDVELAAGWHPITVEYLDASGNARLVCMIGQDGDEYPLDLATHLFHVAAE